ncbi:hypothetical protein C2S51_008786 [Perilla frutescens var. frutescens]|nr:hypothetical protein C2S51_008786 [Perilla frutescens var. frutescens]
MDGDNIKCPCKRCDNIPFQSPYMVRTQIEKFGFVKDYKICRFQGETSADAMNSGNLEDEQDCIEEDRNRILFFVSDPVTERIKIHRVRVLNSCDIGEHMCINASVRDLDLSEVPSGSEAASRIDSSGRIWVTIEKEILMPTNDVAKAITTFFKRKIHPEGINWKSVPADMRQSYFEEFEASSSIEEGLARDKGVQMDKTAWEVFNRLHYNNGVYSDSKSARIATEVLARANALSQPVEGSTETPEVDMNKVYLDVVGITSKKRVFRVGCQSVAYTTSSSSIQFVATSQPITQDIVAEIQAEKSVTEGCEKPTMTKEGKQMEIEEGEWIVPQKNWYNVNSKTLNAIFSAVDLENIQSLPKKFACKVAAIEEAKDIKSMRLDELIGSLRTFEMNLEDEDRTSRKREIALKTKVSKDNFSRMLKRANNQSSRKFNNRRQPFGNTQQERNFNNDQKEHQQSNLKMGDTMQRISDSDEETIAFTAKVSEFQDPFEYVKEDESDNEDFSKEEFVKTYKEMYTKWLEVVEINKTLQSPNKSLMEEKEKLTKSDSDQKVVIQQKERKIAELSSELKSIKKNVTMLNNGIKNLDRFLLPRNILERVIQVLGTMEVNLRPFLSKKVQVNQCMYIRMFRRIKRTLKIEG